MFAAFNLDRDCQVGVHREAKWISGQESEKWKENPGEDEAAAGLSATLYPEESQKVNENMDKVQISYSFTFILQYCPLHSKKKKSWRRKRKNISFWLTLARDILENYLWQMKFSLSKLAHYKAATESIENGGYL